MELTAASNAFRKLEGAFRHTPPEQLKTESAASKHQNKTKAKPKRNKDETQKLSRT